MAVTPEGDDRGILRMEFDGAEGQEALEESTWEEFFCEFEESRLAFQDQAEISGVSLAAWWLCRTTWPHARGMRTGLAHARGGRKAVL